MPRRGSEGDAEALGAETRRRGIYIHVPFCRRRCPYCDFQIEVGASQRGFAEAVVAEAEARVPHGLHHTLSFGGGTPSSLPTQELGQIVSALKSRLTEGAEVALEVNPEDVDRSYAAGLKAAGFTRVSVGLQSFDDDVLAYLGRAHDGARGGAAIGALLDEGVDVGVDLIVGVPGESAERLSRDIDRARSLGVAHVSAYVLTLEEGTPLVQLIAQQKRAAIDDDMQAAAYERVQGLCADAGYRQYEVSSHAHPGKESQHNRLYWQRGDYTGLGPGAASFYVDDAGRAVRHHNRARLADYLRGERGVEEEVLAPAHALREAVAFGLRDLLHGVDLEELAALHHTTVPASLREVVAAAVEGGDVEARGSRFYVSSSGVLFADRVARNVLAS